MAKTPEKKKRPIANGEYKSDARLAREAEKRNELKKAAIKKLVITGVAALLAIAILVTGIIFAYNKVLDSGILMRGRNAMETVNFKVTNAMMSYYIYDNLNDYVDEVGEEFLASYKLDLNKSLKKQKGKDTGNATWFEYFLGEAMDETEDMLLLLEGAKRDSITLTDAELEAVKTEAASLNPADYGRGVRAEDIEQAMIYRATADKYAIWLEESVSVSAEEISKYIEDNKDKFLEVDYRYYTVKYDKEDATDSSSSDVSSETTSSGSEPERAGRDRLAAKDLAKQLENCTTEEEFIAKVTELFGADLEDEEKERLVEGTLFTGLKKSTSGEVSTWAFDEETKVNDTKNIEDETNGSFTVYMLVSEPKVNENLVAEIHRILFTDDLDDAKAEAEKVFGDWNDAEKTPEKTEAAFENLGKAQTNKDIEYTYYEALYKGQFDKALDEWIYAEDRVEGDTVLLEDGDGWNILYFKALGDKQCDYEAKKAIFNEKLDALYEVLEDSYIIIFHHNYMNSIPA